MSLRKSRLLLVLVNSRSKGCCGCCGSSSLIYWLRHRVPASSERKQICLNEFRWIELTRICLNPPKNIRRRNDRTVKFRQANHCRGSRASISIHFRHSSASRPFGQLIGPFDSISGSSIANRRVGNPSNDDHDQARGDHQ